MQLRQLLQGKTTVLAGPSGVGKSSIINALRFVALDDAQKQRLTRFEDAMADEVDMYTCASDPESTYDAEPPHTVSHAHAASASAGDGSGSGVEATIDSDAEAQHASGTSGYGSTQAAWKRRSGNIYGAQVSTI